MNRNRTLEEINKEFMIRINHKLRKMLMTASKFLKCGPKFYSSFINSNKVIENGTK